MSYINTIVNSIRTRVRAYNQNALIIFCGATGSGKSYSALKLASAVDYSFNPDRIVFTPIEFMELIKDYKKIKKTHCLVWDETGCNYSARDFAKESNKILNHVMESFRNRNLIIIMTTPSFDFIDINARKLLHYYFETISINRREKKVVCKPLKVSASSRTGKIYMKYPVVVRNSQVITLNRINFGLPRNDLIKAYEKKKDYFVRELTKEVYEKLKYKSELQLERKKIFNPREYVEKIKKLSWNKITINRIQAEFGLSQFKAGQVRSLL